MPAIAKLDSIPSCNSFLLMDAHATKPVAQPPRPEEVRPVFVLGRQHSGNTMLTTVLGRLPSMVTMRAEGTFIENWSLLDQLPPHDRAHRTARQIRDDGARKLFRDADFGTEIKGFWEEVTEEMVTAAENGAGATELYVVGMKRVLDLFRASRWVQKGTSYIFVAEDILKIFPRSRLIYIARNPLDLAASTKKRNKTGHHTLRVALGWRRGVQRAVVLSKRYPSRFLIVRYEDLVQKPEDLVREICTFSGLPYDPVCLEIPHVNKAESPYRTRGEMIGLTASRLYYYDTVLSHGESAAIWTVVGDATMGALYPELAEKKSPRPVGRLLSVLAAGAVEIAVGEVKRLLKSPARTMERVVRRLPGRNVSG